MGGAELEADVKLTAEMQHCCSAVLRCLPCLELGSAGNSDYRKSKGSYGGCSILRCTSYVARRGWGPQCESLRCRDERTAAKLSRGVDFVSCKITRKSFDVTVKQ